MKWLYLLLLLPLSGYSAEPCPTGPHSGFVPMQGGKERSVYWKRLPSPSPDKKGVVFYLAGGPVDHSLYGDLAAAFQRAALPEFDFILYDYYGLGCSRGNLQFSDLPHANPFLKMEQMARDFRALKHTLVGPEEKVVLMGGSHGAMLAAQIIANFPREVEKAILFSGDTKSGWLKNGWFRFDRILQEKMKKDSAFSRNLTELFARAEAGELGVIAETGVRIAISRETLEVILWLSSSQEAATLNELPSRIAETLEGKQDWIAPWVATYYLLLETGSPKSPLAASSLVTNFHRCNVWMPKSDRKSAPGTKLLRPSSFFSYWNQLCADFDSLGEFPWQVIGARTNVPILVWTGSLDYFEPRENEISWKKLSSRVDFHLKEGWAHDFGLDGTKGFIEVVEMIQTFLKN